MDDETYDIAILGAGPIGLEAALRAADAGYKTVVTERGEIAQNVRDWGHIRLFSPFGMNSSERGRHAVARSFDCDAYLTGGDYVETYLAPLAQYVSHSVEFRTNCEVAFVERLGWPKGRGLGNPARAEADFLTHCTDDHNDDTVIASRCVIDTTGTTNTGVAAERGRLRILSPNDPIIKMAKDLNDRLAVVGTGATAATNVVTLAEADVPFDWFTRNSDEDPVPLVEGDPLPGRRELFAKANAASQSPSCHRVGDRTYSREIEEANRDTIETIDAEGRRHRHSCLEAIINIGQAPDTTIFRELHVHLCYATEGPIKLAAKLLGETGGDCLTQSGSDASLLVNPEPNFFILGAKSYGRNSNFLIRAGIEQVNAVFDELLPQTHWPLIDRTG